MNTRTRTLFLALLILLAAFFVLSPALAQDTTPSPDTPAATAEPTAEVTPAPVDTTTTTTTTTTAPLQDIGITLTWALAFLTLWQAAGIAYAITVEKTVKPMLYSIVDTFTTNTTVRSGLLIIAVFAGAFTAVSTGGINLFADAPFGLFTDAAPSFLLVLNSVFVAAGAFMGHEIWDMLEAWLKKAKAVSDVLTPPPVLEVQLAEAESDLSRIPSRDLAAALKRRGGYVVVPSKQQQSNSGFPEGSESAGL